MGQSQGSIVIVEKGNYKLVTIYQDVVGGTLDILIEKQPGDRHWTSDQKESETCHMESIQTRGQQIGPCLEEQP